ncbi:MAG: DUF1573 domain-containing protein [Paramuribaculum sp.]|nr:DUF1573 domain-containing protein [Paramuribaculum sp.]
MKRLFTLACAFFAVLAACAQGFVWLDTVHDFGSFSEDIGLARCTFRAVNTSDKPIAVISARANCGCTHPEYPKAAVQPGDTLKVSVAYDAKGRPGRFEKKVYVDTGDGISTTLRVKGTVIGAPSSLSGRYPIDAGKARFSATVIPFGETLKGRVAQGVVKGYNTTSDYIEPRVEGLPKYVDVNIRPEKVPPGEQFVVSATVTTDRCSRWGFVTDSLFILPDKDSDTRVPVSTVVIIREDFSRLTPGERAKAPHASMSEKALDFGTFSRNDSPASLKFKITNSGENPLLIREVSSPDKSLAIKVSEMKVKKNKSANVIVTFDPQALGNAELLNARITVITNDPDNPVQMVRVVGEPQ